MIFPRYLCPTQRSIFILSSLTLQQHKLTVSLNETCGWWRHFWDPRIGGKYRVHFVITNSIYLSRYLFIIVVTFLVVALLFYVSDYNHRRHVCLCVLTEDTCLCVCMLTEDTCLCVCVLTEDTCLCVCAHKGHASAWKQTNAVKHTFHDCYPAATEFGTFTLWPAFHKSKQHYGLCKSQAVPDTALASG